MALNDFFFTSESVSEGHPDKVADQISDSVVDALLEQDSKSRIACETLIKTGMVMLAGEITSKANVDFDGVVRDALKRIGYDSKECGCDYESVAVLTNLSQQSPDIAQGVDDCLLYTSPSPRDATLSRMPSSA